MECVYLFLILIMKKTRQPKVGATSRGAKNKEDNSPQVYQKNKISYPLSIATRSDFTEKQMDLIDLILDKKNSVIFINGVSGTSKTFTAIYAALQLMNKKTVSDLVYVRSIAESASKGLGSLPGDFRDKMDPFLMPLEEKLDELLPKADIDRLKKEDRIQGIPVNYLRGASINAKCVVVDEAQNLTRQELTTVITRIGMYSKFIFLGDPSQSDINGKSGFLNMYNKFNQPSSRDVGIHCFTFDKSDVVRSGILKHILDRLEDDYTPPSKKVMEGPMFEDQGKS